MKNKRGFTLVELLVVIAILGLMLIIAIPTIQKSGRNAKIKMCKNKLNAIFDVVSLWASNNLDYFDSDSSKCQSLFIKCDYSSNEFVTTMDILASQGIISYDNDNDDNKIVSNPINNTSLNDNYIKIKKNNDSFEVIFQKVQEDGSTTDDINLDNTCGKTYIGNDDYDSDLQDSFFDTKEYMVHICKESERCDAGRKIKIKNAEPYMYSACSNITPQYYSFTRYENDINDINCYYERETYNITIINNGFEYTLDSNKHKWGDAVYIYYENMPNNELDSILCDGRLCESIRYDIDEENHYIFLEMPKHDLTIEFQKKYVPNNFDFVIALERVNTTSGERDELYYKMFDVNYLNIGQIKDLCTNYTKTNFHFNKNLTIVNEEQKSVKCYFDRDTYNITINKDSHVNNVSILPSASKYKFGETITLNYSFASGYKLNTIEFNPSSIGTIEKSGNSAKFEMPASDVVVTISSRLSNDYNVIRYLENANNDNYVKDKDYSNQEGVSDASSINLNTVCNNNKPANYYYSNIDAALSSADTSLKVIYCYYDRNRYTMTYNYADNVDSTSLAANEVQTGSNVKKYLPSTNRTFNTITNTDVYTNQTATYKYEQDIVFNYVSNRIGYEFDKNICSNESNCKHVGTTTLIKMPASNFTITPKLKYHYETYKIKIFLENANNDNYLEYSKYNTTNSYITLNKSDTTIINNNCNTYFTTDNTMQTNFTKTTLSSAQNVVDKTDNTISCYYDRKRYTMTYDYSDNTDEDTVATKNNIKKYLPSNNRTFDVITSTNNYNSNNITSYKHGQNAVFYYYNINVGYEFSRNECSVSGACIPVGQMMLITMPKSDLTLKPKSKLETETFTVNVFIENANNDNYRQDKSLTSTEVITFKDSDSDIITRACSKNVPAYYQNTALSQVNNSLDRDDKTINCYYSSNRYTLTYNFTDNTDTNKEVSTNSNVKKYVPSDNRSFSVSTYNDNYSTITSSYKHGQNIVFKYESVNIGYQFNQTTCNPSANCNHIGNISIVTMPKGNLTLTPTTKLKYDAYTVKVFLENANNDNYKQNASLNKNVNITFKDLDSTIINRECASSVPTYYENVDISKVNNTLDRNDKTINCYYKATRYTLTYDFTDSNITQKFYTPINSRGTSGTSNTSYSTVQSTYKYGQIIYLNAATFTSGHSINNFYCSLNSCTQIGNTAKIIMPSASLTVKPISK